MGYVENYKCRHININYIHNFKLTDKVPTLQEWNQNNVTVWGAMKDTIKFKRLQLQGDHFAQGAFSQVFKAKYNHTTVCVKRVRTKQSSDITQIQREITLLRKSKHNNIVKLIGHCENDKTFYIVTEWIEGGNLRQYLKDYLIEIPWEVRVKIAKGIARGIKALHDNGILHRDIKSRNILLERTKNTPKVCDFGFASEISDLDNTCCGTGEWMAPELYNGIGSNSEKIDIFSYGIVLIEIITRKNIARDLPRSSAANYGVDVELLKQHTPYDCPPVLLDLAISCCDFDPAVRPEWPEILEILDELRNSFPPSTPSCFDESENNGSTTDNYADDDENEETEDNEDYNDDFEFSPPSSPVSPSISSCSSQSSVSSKIPPVPPFLYLHQNTPQPSPSSSPSSSPHLSRYNKKTPAFRFQLTHNKSGNISDSGSSSGGSLRERVCRNSSKRGNILNMTIPPSNHNNSNNNTSPNSTPRKQYPSSSLFLPYSSISEPNTPKGRPSTPHASASTLDLPSHNLSLENSTTICAEINVPQQQTTERKTKDYAKQFLRKFAPARFSRSKSDPCITLPLPLSLSPTLSPHKEIIIKQQQEENKTGGGTHAHDTLRTRMRRRRDTGDPRLAGNDAWYAERNETHAHDERKDAEHTQTPTQEYATREEQEEEEEKRDKEREQFLYGRDGLVRSSPEPRAEFSMQKKTKIKK